MEDKFSNTQQHLSVVQIGVGHTTAGKGWTLKLKNTLEQCAIVAGCFDGCGTHSLIYKAVNHLS